MLSQTVRPTTATVWHHGAGCMYIAFVTKQTTLSIATSRSSRKKMRRESLSLPRTGSESSKSSIATRNATASA